MSGATPVYNVKIVYRRCTSAGCWPHPLLFHPYIVPNAQCTLTTNFRYRRLGDLNRGPATLCACAGGEQQTIIKIVIHFL